jgi:hypothetical protein
MRPVNKALLHVSRRAERSSGSQLLASFVDVGELSASVRGLDHQIMYGRRGTGKTHVLSILGQSAREARDLAVQLDLRTLGSTGGIYADLSLPLAERATRLLSDLLWGIHDGIMGIAIDDESVDLGDVQSRLDLLASSISEVRVVGQTTQTAARTDSVADTSSFGIGFAASLQPSISTQAGIANRTEASSALTQSTTGETRHRIHFGNVVRDLQALLSVMPTKRLWLLLDEWSEVPLDLQPYLGDFLRRTVFPIGRITVKIAAIEQRTNFRTALSDGSYIGIEIGADGSPSLTLDDFMVFDNDAQASTSFFRALLWKHVVSVDAAGEVAGWSEDQFASEAFTQVSAIQELARAAEGVPRDAINIAAIAARIAGDRKIAVADVRTAARQWYQQSKEATVNSRAQAPELLHWIIQEVIGGRRARAFLLPTSTRDELIDYLYDSRVLHVIKKSVSSNETPGARYNVYAIDYGCYVDLISTANAPAGLFAVDDDTSANGVTFVDVPTTDYRSIRRAILDLQQFSSRSV